MNAVARERARCRSSAVASAGSPHAVGSSATNPSAAAGDIVAIAGIEDIGIGDTISDRDNPKPLPALRIDEPTIAMIFSSNNSPWAGREGDFVTSRKLRERLYHEQKKNVSLRIADTEQSDSFQVTGRGEFQLAIIIETMRREGYEMMVSKPTVVTRDVNGAHSPWRSGAPPATSKNPSSCWLSISPKILSAWFPNSSPCAKVK